MTIKNILLLGFCLIVFRPHLSGQQKQINFTSLTTEDGLSSNTVNAILKDKFGIVWFGTEDGLDRFDGIRFSIYRHKPGDSTSLQANEILSLYEDLDGNLWVGTSGGSVSRYDRKNDCFIHLPATSSPGTIRNNVIRSVCRDNSGHLWIAHFGGVDIFDINTGNISRFSTFSKNPAYEINSSGMCLFKDSRNQMWIGTTHSLYRYNLNTAVLYEFVHSDENPSSLSGFIINAITEDKMGNIWVGTNGGLSKLRPGSDDFINFRHSDQNATTLSGNEVNAVAVNGEKLWIGTTEGLDIMNTRTGEMEKFSLDPRNLHSLTARSVKSIYIDKQGIYWIGTTGGGVDKYDKNLNLFNYVKSDVFDDQGLSSPIVSAFAEAENGKVFVGTFGKGLSLFDPDSKLFKHFTILSRRKNAGDGLLVLTLQMTRKKQLLVGTFGDGLFVVDPKSGKYSQLLQGDGAEDLNSNQIYSLTQLRNGNILVGTNGDGINVLNEDLKVIKRYTPFPKAAIDVTLPVNGYIRDLKEDKHGNIWIATHGGGLAMLEPGAGKFSIYTSYNSALPNDKVQSILEDSRGLIWVGTFGGGLAMYDNNTKGFTVFSEKDGLQNSTIYKVAEDKAGLIWVSTNQGISSIEVKSKNINNYNYHNGIQHNNFFHGAGVRLSGGELYFGGLDGFNYFNPAYLIKNNNIPPVLITDLRISNQSVTPSANGPIKENISIAKEIRLDYKQNFALEFVGLSYTTPEQNRYAYKLEGFDKDWNNVGNSTSASYTNLDPGDYVFKIRASNNDGVWNEIGTSIKVHVHPPFWRTMYAYVFYVLVALASILYLRHRGISKLKRKFALDQEKIYAEQERRETERIHELDRVKIKFLTNLSHEFRTPISLILGPVDSLITQEKNAHSFNQLDIIKRNARRLLNLVNQLLDFRKMEVQELKFNAAEGELVTFIKEVSDSFKDLAERKNIAFNFSSQIDQLYAPFDHDKLERILFNVLSNAFKFTGAGGKINLDLENNENDSATSKTWVLIKVSDTGIGIPEDKKEKIFDLFFQNDTDASILNQGTGIGLSITKEFVKMHGGTITVESQKEQGASFNILLPFTPVEHTENQLVKVAQNYVEESLSTSLEESEANPIALANQHEIPCVLLVEDNDDFRFYLKDNLRLKYKVLEASNGKIGWQKALAHHPQLIVSDISMPEMDGIELCRKIKSDKRTSHIPILLLTALTGEEDQLKGLNTGANDYITKPFNVELLNAKIKNLLVLNSTLKNTYSKQIKGIFPEIETESTDEKLLQTIMKYLEENISNSQLSVEELSRHVGMSRSSLYSKLLELTGETPVEYIRSVKLDKAAILLEKSDMNIAQIAYSVGFSTPNYFAKSFKGKFNMLPSEFINKKRKDVEKGNSES
ncbi:MAG: two-component regulator propeller domain-containing protein [Ferruginibacter sp.]